MDDPLPTVAAFPELVRRLWREKVDR